MLATRPNPDEQTAMASAAAMAPDISLEDLEDPRILDVSLIGVV